MQRICKKPCLRNTESLPHEVVERILERLPVNTLFRFKTVSKQWKSTIEESRFFQERQYNHHLLQQSTSDHLYLAMVSTIKGYDDDKKAEEYELLSTVVLGSSEEETTVKIIPTSNWDDKENLQYIVSRNSCDGLICIYYELNKVYIVNPTTRWYRPLPPSHLQLIMIRLGFAGYFDISNQIFRLGFGKDVGKFNRTTTTYKPVWLYNSEQEFGLENATTCEVFDFGTNSWRFVTPSSPYRVLGYPDPVFVDGSLHWLTECEETKVVSFDLHTETFKVLAKAPFKANALRYEMSSCILDNRLCLCHMNGGSFQVIWSFDSINKKWDKIWSIFNMDFAYSCAAIQPLVHLDDGIYNKEKEKKKKKKRLLFHDRYALKSLFIADDASDPGIAYDKAFTCERIGFTVSYIPSLISI
ncbi:unnamed protein product [Cochlearia groenlandica]